MISKIKALFANAPEGSQEQLTASEKRISKYASLETDLGYTFKDYTLLERALTHKSSIQAEKDPKGLLSNERLEFLGDAVVDCLVTEELYHRYGEHSEGQLSKMKSLLVSRKILGIIANRINLDSYIIKGRSEKKNRSKRSSSIESNAFESILGAVYLDSGLEVVRQILKRLFYPNIEHFVNDVENRNYKSRILEMAQSDGLGIPQYPHVGEEGPDHMKKFTVAIEVAGVRLGVGTGKNKKEAQQEAARIAVKKYKRSLFEKKEK